MIKISVPATLAVALTCLSGAAAAHIELVDPPARYPMARSGDNKACPCGDGTSNRTCGVPGERSDDNRSTLVTDLVAGEMLTVRFNEYVGHSGRYRIAFDNDGADLDDFNAHPLEDIPDPPRNEGNIGDGSLWEIPVLVPDTPCTNCTLQLIQMMDGDMSAPVDDPVGRSSYYTCADITIRAAEDGNNSGSSGSSNSGSSGSSNSEDAASAPDDSGCNIGHGSTSGSLQAALAIAAGLLVAIRRRSSGKSGAQ